MTQGCVCIQARMSSARLPGKVLAKISGHYSVLDYVVGAASAAGVGDVWVLTSSELEDDPIRIWCLNNGVRCFSGPLYDVLKRFSLFLESEMGSGYDFCVRLTADNPLLDASIIQKVVTLYLDQRVQYCSNIDPPTFPDGLDVEVVSSNILLNLNKTLSQHETEYREHVTLALREPSRNLRVANYYNKVDFSDVRWTVDDQIDLTRVRGLIEQHNIDIGQATFRILES